MKIIVLDAAFGSGKTNKLIDMMANKPATSKIIYITPLLSECHRIAGTSYEESDVFKRPIHIIGDGITGEYLYDDNHILKTKRFRHPNNYKGKTKLDDVNYLIENGCNIVSTHSLFSNFNKNVIEKLEHYNYTLVLDEVISVYEQADDLINKKELSNLLKSSILTIDIDGYTLQFNRDKFEHPSDTRYAELANLCDLGQLLLVDGQAVIWEFPISILKSFSEIYIATYMFEGSQLCAFLKANGLEYITKKFGKNPSEYKHFIDIVSDRKMNSYGDKIHSMSSSDIVENRNHHDEMRKSLHTFFASKNKTKSEDRLWTTFKPVCRAISNGKYSGCWLASNTKATNDYQNTWCVAYLLNVYPNPMVNKILAYKGVSLAQADYALSEMIQFIWRSRIRNNEPIQLYIPSRRMRELLIQWLNDEFV